MESTHGILNQNKETRPEDWRAWHAEEYGPAGGPQAAHRLGVMMARGARQSKTREYAQATGLNPPTASEVGGQVFVANVGRLLAHGLAVQEHTICVKCLGDAEVLYRYTDLELALTDEPVYHCDNTEECESVPPWIVRPVGVIPCPGAGEEVSEDNFRESWLTTGPLYFTDCGHCGNATAVVWPQEKTDETNPFGYVGPHDFYLPYLPPAPLLREERCGDCGWLANNQNDDHHPDCETPPTVGKYRGLWRAVRLAWGRHLTLVLVIVLALAAMSSLFSCTPQQANQWLHDYYVSTGDPRACTEDMACWDCETMGNRDCGPAQNHRGSMGTMSVRAGERHQCHTDLECESQYRVAITGEAL